MGFYSMPRYFQQLPQVGKVLKKVDEDNTAKLKAIEEEIHQLVKAAEDAGRSTESLNASGQLTALQRVEKLVEPGTWRPLNSLFNPEGNKNGSVSIVKGLGKINGKWAVVVASDNKKLAGAWVPGQAECLLRASDTAKTLHIPLVYVLNCSGVKFDEQEKVYPNRRGGGTPFFRNAELNQLGVPVIVGIYGTNPAGGGYHSISPTVLIAHEKANMAVGGAGILGGMNPKGYIDMEGANQIADMVDRSGKQEPPGAVDIHFTETGFMREVYASEEGVLEGIKKYIGMLPSYNPEFFRVDDPKAPALPSEDLYSMVPLNDKRAYDIYNVLGRLFDNSELKEYKKGYGPEMITGMAKVNGLLVGVVANVQGLLMNYPEYKAAGSVGMGGKLYRQGLVKMNEFVTLCARDRLPIVWVQDTTGIDVGNDAEKAELLGLGQSLIYSIQTSHVPQFEITLRKGSAAAHYVLGGPQGNDTNAFSIGTAATEIYVMNGETAATAMYSRRLAKDRKAGKDLQPTIDKMNDLIQAFHTKSRPKVCAELGLVDEIVDMTALRGYVEAFTEAAYQNPESICPFHQMLLPRAIREFDTFVKK
ncbi:glutaconyl-CoA decarboxylase subunit alpha [Acidaminococcus sp. NSJ-142]|jgi:glutaconyl-CoA decarboxylase|uniref:sodium ion-translocating glutaconyl-CoA decarboxylase subunit alpha n=1 Tax=Acidaminococcus TaxID=904 RepID=UPI000CF9E774|nr:MULTISPECIES: sodium ion-translocating glutaconyl-CoA decarboxylase subunit alpha [Acidaminococcus]MCD2435732.1 glutaconyl-CoA decarboxylase subunit alpha [Acidaminococcus hominis]MCH4096447.1 glutaconyl-CoA decarboxylase subunit alpha [Acidaminococcus provencensis]RHK02877.1 glutaconyl-CoA decarboxylase subunit alpha [Acidaminococcus sp. AM05-11]